ncbi:MAG: hypothetical protein IID12_02820 [Candidatus Marinimicrobia bacterium]|nr:hypothetical protein [Candidatus Neomarinimicrobiota bacterium]
MKQTYSNAQALTFSALFALMIFISACEEEFPVESFDRDTSAVQPSIDTVRAVYNDLIQQFFLEAAVSDPQGLTDIDTVTYTAMRIGSSDSITGGLNDNGTNGDIIQGDGRYSAYLSPQLVDSVTGSFKFTVYASDLDSNASPQFELLFDITNYQPELSLFSVTGSVALGDTIFIETAVSDANGLSDIRKVTYDIFRVSDSTLIEDQSFVMRDDGSFGDRVALDGIYSVKQPTNPTGATGVFIFLITAEDFAGLKSEELGVPVTITD